ncbi:MAG: hypothetical protein IJS32_07540 [Kiritimatiellae bacterium]|nr:hypothetical protein [Kiritimatiellia bacterium]
MNTAKQRNPTQGRKERGEDLDAARRKPGKGPDSKFPDTIESLMHARRFDEALRRIEESGHGMLSPRLWVLRGMCLQMADSTELPLDEAKKSFQHALDLDGQCLDAWIELGYYVLNVEDNAREAEAIFLKATRLLSGFEKEIGKGLRACKEELEEKGRKRDTP